MLRQFFETTVSAGTSEVELFNSETYQGIDCEQALFAGFSFLNTGSNNGMVTFQTKTHPDSNWNIFTSISGPTIYSYVASAGSGGTTIAESFFRQTAIGFSPVSSINFIAPNSTIFVEVNLKYVYAIRVMAFTSAGTNTFRARGNFAIPSKSGQTQYQEFPIQTYTAGTVSSATTPQWMDCSKANSASFTINNQGMVAPTSGIASGVFPGMGALPGLIYCFRFFPNDNYFIWSEDAGSSGAFDRRSPLIQASFAIGNTAGASGWAYARALCHGASEMGFLVNIPAGSRIDWYGSVNG